MVSLQRLCRAITALALLQPAVANKQSPLTTPSEVQTEASDSPACKDVFFATMHVARNTTSGDKSLPVIHRNGRLYAKEGKDPTHWEIQKNQNGGYFISTPHPSGGHHWWGFNAYESAIEVAASNYQAKEVRFAQTGEADTPFSKVTVVMDDRCLVVPDENELHNPLRMLQLSACDPIILEFHERLEWKDIGNICKQDEVVPAGGCQTFRDCSMWECAFKWRCCDPNHRDNPEFGDTGKCSCVDTDIGEDTWNRRCS